MRKDKPSMTARKVALGIVTLGMKAGMDKTLFNTFLLYCCFLNASLQYNISNGNQHLLL